VADVYSQQLAKGHAVVSGTLEVPAGFIWVIRTITVFYPEDGGGLSQLVGNTSLVTIFHDTAGPVVVGGQWRYWAYLNIVLPPVETYQLSGSGSPDITLNGYALTLP
jgi:hypothetical protein